MDIEDNLSGLELMENLTDLAQQLINLTIWRQNNE
jgi:hypothetical protein